MAFSIENLTINFKGTTIDATNTVTSDESGYESSSNRCDLNQIEDISAEEECYMTKITENVSQNMTVKSSRYALLGTIGRGNFAKVKLAKHLETNRDVAIKIIDKTKLKKKALRMIRREVVMMKELHHPNIVQLLEVMENETTLYLVMEYANGGNLFENMAEKGSMRENEARTVFRKLISALLYCHSKSIVHRDIKAENILINNQVEIKMGDFGFSNEYSNDSTMNTYCGSPLYAAPELYQGKKYIGPEVDIWALGVMLFQLVSGRLPFGGSHCADIKEKVVNLRYHLPNFVSKECKNLLKKILVHAKTRASLETIINDPWVNAGGLPKITLYKDNEFIICPRRRNILIGMGYLEADIDDTFKSKKFNNIHATYVLLKPAPTIEAPMTDARSADSGLRDWFSGQYQPPINQLTRKSVPPDSTTPKANSANRHAFMATINQLSMMRRHKVTSQQHTVNALTQSQIMEQNQQSAPPILQNDARVGKTIRNGKFTVKNIESNSTALEVAARLDKEDKDETDFIKTSKKEQKPKSIISTLKKIYHECFRKPGKS